MVEPLIISQNATILEALRIIDENALGVAFAVDEQLKLVGVITDGDIRRALLKNTGLEQIIADAMTKNFVSLAHTSTTKTINRKLKGKIRIIPLVDQSGVPVDYVTQYRHHRIPIAEPILADKELEYVTECIKSGWVSSQGKFCTEFEKSFSDYIGVENGVLVTSGTTALHLSLLALGVGPGDEVIVPDLTFAASAATVIHAGATPVLVDVERDSWCLDPAAMEKAITKNTKAVMPVHLYGQPADMNEIAAIARHHNLFVVEDAAEALGATYDGKNVGNLGDAAAFSFFGNKLITTGEGGIALFRNPEHAERARMLRDHGMDPEKKYWHLEAGFNYRMTNLQAALGLAQLEKIDEIIRQKNRINDLYRSELKDCTFVELQHEFGDRTSICWTFSMLLDEGLIEGGRDEVIKKLLANGIEARPIFYPLHQMPPYQSERGDKSYRNSIAISKKGISLPSAISLTSDEVYHVVSTIKRIMRVSNLIETVS